ncbi:transposable element Tc3 transposase [Trichonephila clavipes]|nr:transposable element Tc3 transposase [Trichonephila clavipes]
MSEKGKPLFLMILIGTMEQNYEIIGLSMVLDKLAKLRIDLTYLSGKNRVQRIRYMQVALPVEWLRQQTKLSHLSEANPQVYVETPLHPEKLTVWRALWAGGIIGPYFFKNDEGHNVTVNGDRYRAMITNFFIPELNNHDVQELWFQKDGATCHTARSTIELLKDTFGDRLISRFGPVNWPPRSCDLTPLDYFLWGYVKSLVYEDKPQTLDHLEDNIRRVIADIRPQMLEKVIEVGRPDWTTSNMPDLQYQQSYARNHI